METLHDLEAGDFVRGGVDEIVENLRKENPEADVDYRNLHTDNNGYLAEVLVEEEAVAVVESRMGNPMVKEVYNLKIKEVEEGL